MSRGKYLSLDEARNMGKIDQFAKEHPLVGMKRIFDDLMDAMAHGEKPDSQLKKRLKGGQTSARVSFAGCSETQTPSHTSQGASSKRGRGSPGSKV